MVSERQALSAWQDVLEQEIGVDEAAMVVDRLDEVVRRRDLDERFDHFVAEVDGRFDRFAAEIDERFESLDDRFESLDDRFESQANRLMAAWRRDLLLIAVPQFAALVAILLRVGG